MNDDLPPLPSAEFSSWHGDDCKTLLNPTGLCNAFPWPPRVPEKPYWVDKGYHGEPLFTADQMRAYARAAVLAERERCAKVCEAEAESLGSGGKRDAAALCCASAIRAGTKSPG